MVYIDHDPAVNTIEDAFLLHGARVALANAEPADPPAALVDPPVRALDGEWPIALMQGLTMHHVSDDQDPCSFVRRDVEALPSASYVVFSQPVESNDGSERRRSRQRCRVSSAS